MSYEQITYFFYSITNTKISLVKEFVSTFTLIMPKTFITLGPGVIIIKLSVVNLSTLSVSCAVLSLQTSFLSAL